MSLLRNRSLPAEIVCIKKTKSFQDLSSGFAEKPLKQITDIILGDYFTNDRAQAIYSPFILDMALVTNKNVVKDEKDHRKGYLMMEILPQNTATRIFSNERYQKWEYQKPYLLDVLENTQKLLESEIAMTDLKPDNTLYDTDTRKATIIDLGGSVKVENNKDLVAFDLKKYSFQTTPEFRASELEGSQGIVDIHKSLSYICGKVIEAVTHKSDSDQQAISQLIKKLTASEPQARISIPEAISELKRMGDDPYRKNIIFSHYINKIKDRLLNKKSAISINEDIDKTKELLITLNATSSDPSKYKNLKTQDLFEKIDKFLASGNPKQVMAIFGIAGSGKSIALQLKFMKAVRDWQPGQPLPVYFNLANGLDLDQFLRTLNSELDTNLTLDSLDGQHLYLDSFDEGLGIESKRETVIKEYFRKLGSPKILITCRSDYLQDNSYDWFTPEESKGLEVCYVTPINYDGHKDLSHMVEKYVNYSNPKQRTTVQQYSAQEYLNRLKELQLTDLIDTGFMFFLVMEVLFQLQDKKEGRVNKVDIYANYISHYQNSQIAKLKNQDQKKKLAEMILTTKTNPDLDLCSFVAELGKHLACQMHLMSQSRLGESNKLFEAFGYDSSLLLKHQSIIHMLKLLPLKIVTTHSGKRLISNQEVKIGFIHETIKNYYLLEAIQSEIEIEGKSLILASKSIVQDSELVRLIALAMKDNPKLTTSFLKAIENSKHDKSTSSVINASNSISLLIAAKYSFSGCDLNNITVKGANIVNGIFQNANLDRASLSGVDMSNVNLIGASLNGTDMRGVNFSIFPDLVGHKNGVQSVSFSPDGKLLASGSLDDTIKIWNPSTGECLQTLNGHTRFVSSVSFSPDGKFLASGSADQKIKIWNLSTSACLHTLKGHSDDIRSVSFSPDGKFVASGSDDCTIKLWNPNTGECLKTLNANEVLMGIEFVWSVIFSPDSKFLASATNDMKIKIWELSTNKCLHTFIGHTDAVTSLSFSSDSKLLASGGGDKTVKIWNSKTGECLYTLKHTETVFSVNFSRDSKFLASSSSDETIKIWNPSTGECLHTLNGHASEVRSVSFSPDGKFIASGSNDKAIKIWNLTTGECLQILNGHADQVESVSFSPNGKFLASGSKDNTINIWNPAIGESLHTKNEHTGHVNSVSFSSDGEFFVSGSHDKTIKIWNTNTSECLHTLNEVGSIVFSVSISPDGNLLAGGLANGNTKIWNLTTKECLYTLSGNGDNVRSVSFSTDGKLLASGSVNGIIFIWDPSTGKSLHCLDEKEGNVYSVSFSPDGKLLASGTRKKKIKIWNTSTGKYMRILIGHSSSVNSVCFSPDGKFLASGSADNTIKIWDPTTTECLYTLNGHTLGVTSVVFSLDGKFLASGSINKTIKIFESEATSNVWLLKRSFTATPSPLVAVGASLKDATISQNNKFMLEQKGADIISSVIDNIIDQTEPHRDTSAEAKNTANHLSQAFLEKFIAPQQSQNSNLDALPQNPDEKPVTISSSNPHQQSQDSKFVVIVPDSRSSNCCQIF